MIVGLQILLLLVLLVAVAIQTAFGLALRYQQEIPRGVRSDPSIYDGYENSFYRGYGSDQAYHFGPQGW